MRTIQIVLAEVQMRDLLRYLNVAGGKFQMEQNSVELERIQELLATLQEGRKVFRPREQEEVFPARGPQGQLLWASREELMAAQAAQGGVSDPSDPSDPPLPPSPQGAA